MFPSLHAELIVANKRILVISTNADEAGVPKHVESIVTGLQHNFSFTVVFGEAGAVSQRIERLPVSVKIVPTLRSTFDLCNDVKAFICILKTAYQLRPALIHCHSSKAMMVGRIAAFLLGLPCICTVHGWGWRGLPCLLSIATYLAELFLARLPNTKYICVCPTVASVANRSLFIPRYAISTIFNGVPDPCVSRTYNLAPPTILMPARVSSAKDHITLLTSFEAAASPSWKLVLCGAGTDSASFVKAAHSISPRTFNQISFLGEVSDMKSLYLACNIVALISNFEALPLSLIEGLSFARPLIGTDVGDVSQIILDGETGFLVPRASPQRLQEAMSKLAAPDLRLSMSVKAHRHFLAAFSLSSMLTSTKTLYMTHCT